MNFDTVDFDVSSRFDVSNDYYVATAAGIYRFSVRAAFNNAAGFLAARAQHRDSSGTSIETVDFQGIENSATTATAGPGGSLLLSLAAGDRVEVEVYTAAGTVCSGVRFDGEYVGAT